MVRENTKKQKKKKGRETKRRNKIKRTGGSSPSGAGWSQRGAPSGPQESRHPRTGGQVRGSSGG
jgi:hypothetical protein